MVLVLGIVKASLEILGIGIGVKKVVLLMSGMGLLCNASKRIQISTGPLLLCRPFCLVNLDEVLWSTLVTPDGPFLQAQHKCNF